MEIIQEFAENQCYLHALTSLQFREVHFNYDDLPEESLRETRGVDKDKVWSLLEQPLGLLFFRYFLAEKQQISHLLFLNSVDEYERLPEGKFRDLQARKIVRKFFSDKSGLSSWDKYPQLQSGVVGTLKSHGATANLFASPKQMVRTHVGESLYDKFLHSKYYSRLRSIKRSELRVVQRADFDFIRVLGVGGFGKVFAVSKRDTKAVYACKIMDKAKVIEKKRKKLIVNERNIFVKVDHPYIVKLKYAFQDSQNLYFILEIVTGGELQFHLNNLRTFDLEWTQFYAAGILLALEYLHSKNIVYRDLKPENVLLDADGHIRLTDLGLCKELPPPDKNLIQHCGTKAYMAPEQSYGREGYRHEVDWWAFGICILVMRLGGDKNPFHPKRQRRRKKESAAKKAVLAADKPAPGQPQPASPATPIVDATAETKNDNIDAPDTPKLPHRSSASVGAPISPSPDPIPESKPEPETTPPAAAAAAVVTDIPDSPTTPGTPATPVTVPTPGTPVVVLVRIPPGTPAELKDLQTEKFNGVAVEVQNWDANVQRYNVKLPSGEIIKVRSENVQQTGSPRSPRASAVQLEEVPQRSRGATFSSRLSSKAGSLVAKMKDKLKKDDPAPRLSSAEEREKREREKKEFYEEGVLSLPNVIKGLAPNTRDIITQCLRLNRKERLGHVSTDCRNHAFFADLNWQRMERRHLVPPFVPNPKMVQAEYVEAAFDGLVKEHSGEDPDHFEDFDFVNPIVYQEEVIGTIHDKSELVTGEASIPARKKKKWCF